MTQELEAVGETNGRGERFEDATLLALKIEDRTTAVAAQGN